MSTVLRSVLLCSLFAAVCNAQSFTSGATLDASNNEMTRPKLGEPRGVGGVGTISVQELARPLEGRGLKLMLKAKDLVARGEIALAMEQLHAAMREPAAEPYALALMATEHLKRGDFNSAITELQASLALMPGVAGNHSNLAYALAVKGRMEEGLVQARRAIQLDPGRPKTRFVLGQILLAMDRKEEAEFHLTRAAEEISGARKLLAKYFGK